MKKFIAIFAFMVIALTSFAQSNSEHLTFKGVPIDGSLNDFVVKMKNEGFNCLGVDEGIAFLQGDFAGFRTCVICVVTLKTVNVVSKVMVRFPFREDWGSLERDYEHLKSMLTQKYGEPSGVVEKFTGVHQSKNNFGKLRELSKNRCVWGTVYETQKGRIHLVLSNTGPGEYCVGLSYEDKINTDKVRAVTIDDL